LATISELGLRAPEPPRRSNVESLIQRLRGGEAMLKTLTALATAATIAVAAVATPTPAEARNGRIAAGIIGGLAAGAIIGGAVAGPYGYYGPRYGYYDGPYPAYYGPRCYWRRVWTEWGPRRIRECY
jgi:hypothetical protein